MTFICHPYPHINENGQEIMELVPEHGDEPENFHRFTTAVNLVLVNPQTGQQHLADQQRVPIDALDIQEAFEKLDEVTKDAGAKMIEAAQKKAASSKIILPGANHAPMIQNGQNGHVNRLRMSE